MLLNSILWLTLPDLQCTTSHVCCTGCATGTINYFITAMLEEDQTHSPQGQITEGCYKKAVHYVKYLPAQKEVCRSRLNNCSACYRENESTANRDQHLHHHHMLSRMFRSHMITAPKKGMAVLQKSMSLKALRRCSMHARRISRTNFGASQQAYYWEYYNGTCQCWTYHTPGHCINSS